MLNQEKITNNGTVFFLTGEPGDRTIKTKYLSLGTMHYGLAATREIYATVARTHRRRCHQLSTLLSAFIIGFSTC